MPRSKAVVRTAALFLIGAAIYGVTIAAAVLIDKYM